MSTSYNIFKNEIKEYICKHFPTNSKILDIGAGYGIYARLLLDYKNIDAVEIYEPYINRFGLKSLYKNVYNIDILDFDFDYYDLIIMGDVLEHIPTEKAQLLIKKIINKCEQLIVCVPYLYKQDADENKYQKHFQEDLTKDVMDKRYPSLNLMWYHEEIGVYVKNLHYGIKKLTVMIPYRNREENLGVFIPYFKSFMKNYSPEIPYKIVVIEQGNDKTFNKGILYNIGFLITSGDTDYYALHDVDALPISSDYSYHKEPQHLFVNTLEQSNNGVFRNINKEALYKNKGGVLTVPTNIYRLANGLSNNYWGWGFEDDDFSFRLYDAGHHLERYGTIMKGGLENNDKGYYVMIYAKSVRFDENEYFRRSYHYFRGVMNKEIDWRLEGLNTTKFELIDTVITSDYTKYIVDFKNDIKNNLKQMEKGISIVMAYYNRKTQLYRTLMSIKNSSYNKKKLEIIIVNDASDNIDEVKSAFSMLDINLVNIRQNQKTWVNCCVPFNIGFNRVKYDKVVIQSPECYHNGDILSYVDNNLTNENYISFGCYSLSFNENNNNDYANTNIINEKPKFISESGWYNHSEYNPTHYHFCSAMKYDNLCRLNGFDEDYKDGVGYDDAEFLHRIKLLGLKTEIIDNPFVFHQWHSSDYHYCPESDSTDKILNVNKLISKNELLYNNRLSNDSYVINNNTYFSKKTDDTNQYRRLNIGITIPFHEKQQTIWANGIRQNVFFLAQTLMNIGKYNVFIVNNGSVPIDNELITDWDMDKYRTADIKDIKYNLDVLFVMASEITFEEGDFFRNNGCKLVFYNCGNQYIFQLENIMKSSGKGIVNYDMYDEIWMVPQMENSSYYYLETISRKKIRVVPFVWNSEFIDTATKDLPNNGKYQPSDNPKRLSIFEPNINIMKYSMYPIIIAERAYRKKPDLIKHLYVTNSTTINTKEMFVNIMYQLDIVKSGKASFESRYSLPWFLSEHTDIVISHQWENALNYAYLDTIYLEYPLIHNASLIKDCGYYYDGFNADKGEEQLLYALTEHDRHIEKYHNKNKKVLDKFLTTNQDNINTYDELIQELVKK